MRSKFCPTFRWFVLTALCAGMAFAAGCASEKPAAPVKPGSLFVDGTPKPAVVLRKDDPGRPKIEVKFETPKGNGIQRSVTLKWAEKDGTQMMCSAKSADFNEVTQVGTLVDFYAQLYENGKLTASVRAPRATADTAKRVIVASGGVVLKSLERATVVRAAWIKWYAGSDKVIGNGGVSIKSTNGSIDGAAFVADTALKTLTIKDSEKGLE
jgi:hypothetical protein